MWKALQSVYGEIGGLNTLVGTLAEEPVVQGYDLGETISVILAE